MPHNSLRRLRPLRFTSGPSLPTAESAESAKTFWALFCVQGAVVLSCGQIKTAQAEEAGYEQHRESRRAARAEP